MFIQLNAFDRNSSGHRCKKIEAANKVEFQSQLVAFESGIPFPCYYFKNEVKYTYEEATLREWERSAGITTYKKEPDTMSDSSRRITQGDISVLIEDKKKMCVYTKINGEERIVAEILLTDTNETVISFAIPVSYGTLSYRDLRDISDIMQDIEFLKKNEAYHQKDRP